MSLSAWTVLLGLFVSSAAPQSIPPNPVSLDPNLTQFLGYRYPTNDQAFPGTTYISTFGDSVPCISYSQNESCGTCDPYGITARVGGAIQGSDPLSYTDINIDTGLTFCNSEPQMARFCPIMGSEDTSAGFGVTNIIGVNATHGVLLNRPTYNTNLSTPGAGIAVVDISSGVPVCSRPFGISSWTADEPTWGQLSSLYNAADGFVYNYANGPGNSVVLNRVPLDEAFELQAYEYYQGDGIFNSSRIYLSQLGDSSPQLLVNANANQGSTFYSPYYGLYIRLSTYLFNAIFASTSATPWGPWSNGQAVYNTPDAGGLFYAPNPLVGFAAEDGKWMLVVYTKGNFQGVVNMTFT